MKIKSEFINNSYITEISLNNKKNTNSIIKTKNNNAKNISKSKTKNN